MNLNNNPSIEELRNYIAKFNDATNSHSIWVDQNGEVQCHIYEHSAYADDDEDDNEKEQPHWMDNPNLQFCLESFGQGMGYVGVKAAADDEWISILHRTLTTNWKKRTRGYIDNFEEVI